jgi:hypothetical protein
VFSILVGYLVSETQRIQNAIQLLAGVSLNASIAKDAVPASALNLRLPTLDTRHMSRHRVSRDMRQAQRGLAESDNVMSQSLERVHLGALFASNIHASPEYWR